MVNNRCSHSETTDSFGILRRVEIIETSSFTVVILQTLATR